MRPVTMHDRSPYAGLALIAFGNTRVWCTATWMIACRPLARGCKSWLGDS